MNSPPLDVPLVVVGAGPGGYPAAFHAADLGLDVVLVDREPHPGGVCLYRGCIPSKALLHAAGLLQSADEARSIGITFGTPQIDLKTLRAWKQSVVDTLTGGLGQLARTRGIHYLQGTATLNGANSLEVRHADGTTTTVRFKNAILATGSEPVQPTFMPDCPRIMDSTSALAIEEIPKSLLVVGGGYIGLELGQAYAMLGTEVDVIEMQSALLPGVDPDLVSRLHKTLKAHFRNIRLGAKISDASATADGVRVRFTDADGQSSVETYARVLTAIGRRPVTRDLGLESIGAKRTSEGFIAVDAHRRIPECPSILAVGDVAGQPMLAHKATHEGRAAVESLHDGKPFYDPRAVPAVVFTDPEIAWCGLSEEDARRQGLNVRIGTFPWEASGRAATLDRRHGITKIVAEADSRRVLGVGIAGHGAGELIGEAMLAIEMGAVADDIALTIHAHPSLSETLMEAAAGIMGQSIHYVHRS